MVRLEAPVKVCGLYGSDWRIRSDHEGYRKYPVSVRRGMRVPAPKSVEVSES